MMIFANSIQRMHFHDSENIMTVPHNDLIFSWNPLENENATSRLLLSYSNWKFSLEIGWEEKGHEKRWPHFWVLKTFFLCHCRCSGRPFTVLRTDFFTLNGGSVQTQVNPSDSRDRRSSVGLRMSFFFLRQSVPSTILQSCHHDR